MSLRCRNIVLPTYRRFDVKPNLSRHAATRSQQRGISASAIDFLLEFGSEHYDHHGAM
jgi:hypothetical protein